MSFIGNLFKKKPLSLKKVFSQKNNFYGIVQEEVERLLSEDGSHEMKKLVDELSMERHDILNERLWRLLLGNGHNQFIATQIKPLLEVRFGKALDINEDCSVFEFVVGSLYKMRELSYAQIQFLNEHLHLPSITEGDKNIFMSDEVIESYMKDQISNALEMDRKRDPEMRGMDVDKIYQTKMHFFNMSHCFLAIVNNK